MNLIVAEIMEGMFLPLYRMFRLPLYGMIIILLPLCRIRSLSPLHVRHLLLPRRLSATQKRRLRPQTPAPTRQHQDKSKSAPACGDAVAAARHSLAAAAAASQPRAEAKTGQVQVNWHESVDKPHRPPPANRDKQWNEHGGLPEAARGKQWDEHGGLPEAARGKQWNEHGGQRWDEYRRWADQTAGSEESDNRSQRKDQRRGTQDIRKGNFGPPSSASDDFPDWFSRVWDYKHKYNSNGDIYDVVPKDPRTGIELEGNLRTQFERWAKQKR